MRRRLFRYVLVPTLLPIMFAIVAATPVEISGCRLRGLLAAGLALAGGFLGLVTVIRGLADKIRNRPGSGWWVLSTLILALPAIYIVLFET
jgi:hypothetical protein